MKPHEIMLNMAKTFAERNEVYGDNYKNVAAVMRCLFPNGVPPQLVLDDKWHLFELVVVKLTRYANSNLQHADSIHDAAVYAAMCESILSEENSHSRRLEKEILSPPPKPDLTSARDATRKIINDETSAPEGCFRRLL